jgi:hypothetical protein
MNKNDFFYKALEHQINLYVFIVFVQFMFFRAALYRLIAQCRYALFHTVNEAGMNKSSSKLIYLNTDLIIYTHNYGMPAKIIKIGVTKYCEQYSI